MHTMTPMLGDRDNPIPWLPDPEQRRLLARLLDHVVRLPERDGGCWLWTASHNVQTGYGQMHVIRDGRKHTVAAHRIAYELLVGPIPDDMEIDHLCRNRWCCNPEHLEVVTRSENVRRGMHPHAILHRNSICKSGTHSLDDPDHAGMHPDGTRYCRTCHRANTRAWKQARKLIALEEAA